MEDKDVNKVAALQILRYCEEKHMSRVKAEEYFQSTHTLIQPITLKPYGEELQDFKEGFSLEYRQENSTFSYGVKNFRKSFGRLRTRNNRPYLH